MSLINQMLRDLERREPTLQPLAALGTGQEQQAAAAAGPQDDMSWSMPAEETDPNRKWQLATAAVAALMLVSGGAWWLGRGSAAHDSTVVSQAQPAAEAELPKPPAAPMIPDLEPDPKAEVPPLPESAAIAAPEPAPPPKPVSVEKAAAAKTVIKAVAKPAPEPKPVKPAAAPAVVQEAKPAAAVPAATPAAPAMPRAEQLYQQAQNELKQGQVDPALNTLRAALDADPKHVQARLNLARLLAERKQLPAAADLLADGIMLLPQQNAFVLGLAPLWFQSGQQDDALALLAQSAKQPSATPQLTSYYAAQLLRLKRPAEAIPQFRAALRSDPSQTDWLIGLGLSLQGTGQNKEAVEVFRRAYETGKLSPERKDLVEQMIAGLKSRP